MTLVLQPHALRRRYGRAAAANFDRYRNHSIDESAGSPLAQWGSVHAHQIGPSWTEAIAVPLAELDGLKAVVQDKRRVQSIRSAIAAGTMLPPIEIGVFKNGGGWLVDGNHRLAAARAMRSSTIDARFTFVE